MIFDASVEIDEFKFPLICKFPTIRISIINGFEPMLYFY